jgi:hypothetical protein
MPHTIHTSRQVELKADAHTGVAADAQPQPGRSQGLSSLMGIADAQRCSTTPSAKADSSRSSKRRRRSGGGSEAAGATPSDAMPRRKDSKQRSKKPQRPAGGGLPTPATTESMEQQRAGAISGLQLVTKESLSASTLTVAAAPTVQPQLASAAPPRHHQLLLLQQGATPLGGLVPLAFLPARRLCVAAGAPPAALEMARATSAAASVTAGSTSTLPASRSPSPTAPLPTASCGPWSVVRATEREVEPAAGQAVVPCYASQEPVPASAGTSLAPPSLRRRPRKQPAPTSSAGPRAVLPSLQPSQQWHGFNEEDPDSGEEASRRDRSSSRQPTPPKDGAPLQVRRSGRSHRTPQQADFFWGSDAALACSNHADRIGQQQKHLQGWLQVCPCGAGAGSGGGPSSGGSTPAGSPLRARLAAGGHAPPAASHISAGSPIQLQPRSATRALATDGRVQVARSAAAGPRPASGAAGTGSASSGTASRATSSSTCPGPCPAQDTGLVAMLPFLMKEAAAHPRAQQGKQPPDQPPDQPQPQPQPQPQLRKQHEHRPQQPPQQQQVPPQQDQPPPQLQPAFAHPVACNKEALLQAAARAGPLATAESVTRGGAPESPSAGQLLCTEMAEDALKPSNTLPLCQELWTQQQRHEQPAAGPAPGSLGLQALHAGSGAAAGATTTWSGGFHKLLPAREPQPAAAALNLAAERKGPCIRPAHPLQLVFRSGPNPLAGEALQEQLWQQGVQQRRPHTGLETADSDHQPPGSLHADMLRAWVPAAPAAMHAAAASPPARQLEGLTGLIPAPLAPGGPSGEAQHCQPRCDRGPLDLLLEAGALLQQASAAASPVQQVQRKPARKRSVPLCLSGLQPPATWHCHVGAAQQAAATAESTAQLHHASGAAGAWPGPAAALADLACRVTNAIGMAGGPMLSPREPVSPASAAKEEAEVAARAAVDLARGQLG